MDKELPPPERKSKLLRRAVLVATVSSVFFLLYIFIPDHWVETSPQGTEQVIFLKDPFYSLIKYLPVIGGAICIAGAFWISFQKFTAASGLLLAFALIAGVITSVGRVSNFPAPWKKYSALPGPDQQIYYYLFQVHRGKQTAALGRYIMQIPFREVIEIIGTTTADSLVDDPDAYATIPTASPTTIGTRNKFGLLMVDDQGMIVGYSSGEKASFGYSTKTKTFYRPEDLRKESLSNRAEDSRFNQ